MLVSLVLRHQRPSRRHPSLRRPRHPPVTVDVAAARTRALPIWTNCGVTSIESSESSLVDHLADATTAAVGQVVPVEVQAVDFSRT